MISELQMQQVLEAALSTGGDFAELFFEDREEVNIPSRNGVLQGVKQIRIHGVGLTVLLGVQRVYVHSNRTGFTSLLKLAKQAAEMIAAQKAGAQALPLTLARYPDPNPVRLYPGEVQTSAKIRALTRAEQAARNAGPKVLSINADLFENDQRILVANSEGLLTTDRRVNTRMRFQVTVGDEKSSFYDWADYTQAQGFEAFANGGCEAYVAQVVRGMEGKWKARPVKACRVPVVMAAGGAGTLWHECCGHGLEACAIASGDSIYVDQIGRRVAGEKVTLIDDGTYPGLYGSSAVDDEGHPRQKNVIIENGVLKQYMSDRLHGRMLGAASNGCGRRQNYTYAATSRMSNTYLAPGTDDEDEIIRSVPEGLYVASLGGGTGGTTFSIIVSEGYWIKNGQIDHQVKGVMLSGNGLDVMQKVDRVGKKVGTEMGGFCGAASGLIPVTSFQPMIRISEMAVGGGAQ